MKKITIILNLKWIFVKILSWQPFFLRTKKPLLLDFIKISSIKPKGTTKFTSLKDFHGNKDNGRCCEIKCKISLLPYIILAIPLKH